MSKEYTNPVISDSSKLRRKEHRFNYNMPISVRTKKELYTGSTINVSAKGLRFSAPANAKPNIIKTDFIYLKIPELNDYLDSFLMDEEQNKIRELFIYQVVHIEYINGKIVIGCETVQHSNDELLMLESYVEDKLHSYQIDHAHEIQNIKHTFYEYLRFDYISELIYYYIPEERKCLFIESEKNHLIYDYLTEENQKDPDLSPFLSPSFLDYIVKKKNTDFDFYLFIFWRGNNLNFKYSFELTTKKDLNQLLQQTVKNNGYILTIMMGLPAPRKMKDTMGWWQREADQYCRDMILKPNVVLNN